MSEREHIHLIGIGGTGMTALAGLLHEQGCRVTGSDRALYPPTSVLLERMGLDVGTGFDPGRLRTAPDRVVIGNAISRGNEELEEVLDRDLPFTSMPRIIAERFLVGRHSMVVSGTHGKTTTASMLAWVLAHAGRQPGYLIGGAPLNFDRPYAVGAGEEFVIEGDEYDTAFFDKGPKFMHYRPRTALLGTIEFDHADIYRDLQQIETAFRRLVNLVPRNGLLVYHADSPVTEEVSGAAFCRVAGYGLERGDWRILEFEDRRDGACFRLERAGRPFVELELQVSGHHNALNATAVAVAAAERGLDAGAIRAGLESFQGVRRRLERRGEAGGVEVFDDFAHHPTAITQTLAAVRRRFGRRRIWAVLEPRSWSLRRNVFQDRLSRCFDEADEILIAPVFGADKLPAAERLDVDRLIADLAARDLRAATAAEVSQLVERVAVNARPGDVVVVMSNGGFEGFHERLLEALASGASTSTRGESPSGVAR